MAPKKETAKKPAGTKPAKRTVFQVEIRRLSYTYAYVEADSPEAAEQMVWDEGDAHDWWPERSDWGDLEVECIDESDEKPDLVAPA